MCPLLSLFRREENRDGVACVPYALHSYCSIAMAFMSQRHKNASWVLASYFPWRNLYQRPWVFRLRDYSFSLVKTDGVPVKVLDVPLQFPHVLLRGHSQKTYAHFQVYGPTLKVLQPPMPCLLYRLVQKKCPLFVLPSSLLPTNLGVIHLLRLHRRGRGGERIGQFCKWQYW